MISGLLGLRVDVDTHDGMRDGVPRLLDVMAAEGVKATFYLSMGPDRSGLAALNALRPGFLAKMTRTGAASVYGWRTVLCRSRGRRHHRVQLRGCLAGTRLR